MTRARNRLIPFLAAAPVLAAAIAGAVVGLRGRSLWPDQVVGAICAVAGVLTICFIVQGLLLSRRYRKSRKWCWYVAATVLVPVSTAAAVVGIHDMIIGSSWSARLLGAIAFALGIIIAAPVLTAPRPKRTLRPLASLSASALLAATALALFVAERGFGPVVGWWLLLPLLLLAVSVSLILMSWVQHGHGFFGQARLTLRQPAGKIIAASAALISLLQIGVSLRSTTHPAPRRVLIVDSATINHRSVAVSVRGANHSGSDLPVLGDLIDVMALHCPNAPTGANRARQSGSERVEASRGVDVTSLLDPLFTSDHCDHLQLLDTVELAGETSFLQPDWAGDWSSTYPLPSHSNTACVFTVMWTTDQNPRRLSVIDNAHMISDADYAANRPEARYGAIGDLLYRYRLDPTGWIDEFIHRSREIGIDWSDTAESSDPVPSPRVYEMPNETEAFVEGGRVAGTADLIAPGPVASGWSSCASA